MTKELRHTCPRLDIPDTNSTVVPTGKKDGRSRRRETHSFQTIFMEGESLGGGEREREKERMRERERGGDRRRRRNKCGW